MKQEPNASYDDIAGNAGNRVEALDADDARVRRWIEVRVAIVIRQDTRRVWNALHDRQFIAWIREVDTPATKAWIGNIMNYNVYRSDRPWLFGRRSSDNHVAVITTRGNDAAKDKKRARGKENKKQRRSQAKNC